MIHAEKLFGDKWFDRDEQSSCHAGSHTMTTKQQPNRKGNSRVVPRPKSQAQKQNNSKRVSAPMAYLTHKSTGTPDIYHGSDGRIRVRHREYIADIFGAGASGTAIATFPVNPGMPITFPWLSALAVCYENYSFKRLSFSYSPACATTQAGMVVLALDYDAADSAPVSKQGLLSMRTSNRGACWSPFDLHSDRSDLHKFSQYFIRSGTLAAMLDVKTYDVANLFVASTGQGNSNICGEIWCEYEVEFFTPQFTAGFNSVRSSKIASGNLPSAAYPFGTLPTVLGSLPIQASGSRLTIGLAGEYLVEILIQGSAFNDGTTLLSLTVVTNTVTNDVTNQFYCLGTTSALISFLVRVNDTSEAILVAVTGPGVVTNTTTRVTDYNYALA